MVQRISKTAQSAQTEAARIPTLKPETART